MNARSPRDPDTAAIEAAKLAGSLSPLVKELCRQLAKRSGCAPSDWLSRVRLDHRKEIPVEADLVIEVGDAEIVIEVGSGLSDDAKRALIHLAIDVEAPRNQRLRWDDHARAWVPASRAP